MARMARSSSPARHAWPVIALSATALVLAACVSSASATLPNDQSTPTPTPLFYGPPAPKHSAQAAPSTTPTPSPTMTPTASPSASPMPTPTSTAFPPSPTASPASGLAACNANQLTARIIGWDGAAGHRTASVQLTNTGSACRLAKLDRPQLIDGHGAVLIDGAAPVGLVTTQIMTAGEVFKALVQDGNYCGPAPLAPVSVAFVLPGSAGRVSAQAVSATDTFGVPPCNGPSGSAGDIEMQAWAP